MKFLNGLFLLLVVATSPVLAESLTAAPRCEVLFLDEVTSGSMKTLLAEVENLDICAEESRARITVQTGGGDVDAGMFAYKILRDRPGGVDTHITYSTASMGVILFLAGDERTMAPGGNILIHEVTRFVSGDYDVVDFGEYTRGMEMYRRDYVTVVADRTGLTREAVEALMAARTYLTATEALKLGFVTAITNR